MRKRFHRRQGKLIQSKRLTDEEQIKYAVIGVNNKTSEITQLGEVSDIEEAKQLKEEKHQDGVRYYILEDSSVLLELE